MAEQIEVQFGMKKWALDGHPYNEVFDVGVLVYIHSSKICLDYAER